MHLIARVSSHSPSPPTYTHQPLQYSPSEREHFVRVLAEGVLATSSFAKELVVGDSKNVEDDSLLGLLVRAGIVEGAAPLHRGELKSIFNRLITLSPFKAPVNEIADYFGSEKAFYFLWLDHFTTWLVVPSVAGFLLWYFRPRDETADNDVTNSYFAIFMVLWGFTFNVFWKREATSHACKWNTLDFEAADEPNPHFRGLMRRSKVTGKDELHYPSHMRWLVHYPVSAVVTGVMLCAAFSIMCLSLNLQGYVHQNSPIYVAALAVYADEGAMFDPSGWGSLVPVVGHTVVILILNTAYREICEWLTEMENHRCVGWGC